MAPAGDEFNDIKKTDSVGITVVSIIV